MVEILAEIICLHSKLRGIPVDEEQHKIGLFANDIILTVADPTSSLLILMEALDTFQKLSHCKINHNKTQALPIRLPHDTINQLKQTYKFEWREIYISYLGVKIPKVINNICKLNFLPLLSTIHADCNQWKKLDLSWLGRIATTNMTMLP